VAALRVVEAFDVVEDIGSGGIVWIGVESFPRRLIQSALPMARRNAASTRGTRPGRRSDTGGREGASPHCAPLPVAQ